MLLLYTMSQVAKCDGYQTLELASNWLQTENKSFVVHKEIKLTQSRRKGQGQGQTSGRKQPPQLLETLSLS